MTEERLPTDWLFEKLNRLEDRMGAHGAEMRKGFTDLQRTFLDHAKEDLTVEKRVTLIEVDRHGEKERADAEAQKRGAVAGLLAAAGLSGLIEAFKHVFK